MLETLAVLLFAHTLADFVLQTNWIASNKRNPLALGLHILIVYATAVAALGSLHPALLILALAHLLIDAAKAWLPWGQKPWLPKKGLTPFLIDQTLHIATLAALALWLPDLWANGFWTLPATEDGMFGSLWPATQTPLPQIAPALMALIAGLIITTREGGFAVGLYMAQWQNDWPGGLPNGGRAIGMLERALIFLLVLTGQSGGIGFLIAAKSVLRFNAVSDDRKFSEYVIIGTLASFGWAIAASIFTVFFLSHLTPLGISAPLP